MGDLLSDAQVENALCELDRMRRNGKLSPDDRPYYRAVVRRFEVGQFTDVVTEAMAANGDHFPTPSQLRGAHGRLFPATADVIDVEARYETADTQALRRLRSQPHSSTVTPRERTQHRIEAIRAVHAGEASLIPAMWREAR